MSRLELVDKLREYASRRGYWLRETLGSGVQATVFAAESDADCELLALKIHEQWSGYKRERDVYLRLRELGVHEIRGAAVPQIYGFDDDDMVIEMSIVTRPFVLDFGGAYLNFPPDFSDEVMAEWRAEKEEQFGKDWPEVMAILRELESYDIYMIDVNPANISFAK